jgi:HlyD family secretion protein
MKIPKTVWITVPFAIVLLIVLILLCSRKSGGDDAEMNYKEYMVERGTLEVQVTANGVVEPIDRIQLKSKASGEIVQMSVEQGDFVRKGQLIARLDQKDEKAAVAQAQADLDIATADLEQATKAYERSEQLYKQNLISEEEKDQIELAYATAKGRLVRATTTLDRARERFDESVVIAPISGILLQKYVEEGQIIASGVSTVGGGSPIVDIADMASVYVKAGVDEIDIGKIRVGQEASAEADAYPNRKFFGKIVRISPEARIDQNVTLFDVIVEVQNPDAKLKSGMNASIEISVVKKENVVLAPAPALQGNGNMAAGGQTFGAGASRAQAGAPFGGQAPGQQAFARQASGQWASVLKPSSTGKTTVLLKKGNGFVPQSIQTGLSNYKQVEILDGLKEGDVIGVPMWSRVKAESDQFEQRIKSERSFGRQNTQQQTAAPGR